MAVSFILGILAGMSKGFLLFPILGGVALLFLPVLWIRKGSGGPSCKTGESWRVGLRVLLFSAMFLLGIVRTRQEEGFREAYLPGLMDGMPISVQGKLSSKEYKNNQIIYHLSSCIVETDVKNTSLNTPVRCNRVLAYSNSDDHSIGQILVLNGRAELFRPAVNEGNFDEISFNRSKKIAFKIKDIRVLGVYGKKCAWKEALFHLSMRLNQVYASAMEPEDAGVMATMVLGNRSFLDSGIKSLYQKAGISHILSISGLHIAVIGMTIYRLIRWAGFGFTGAGAAAGAFMYAYGTMAGMGTSVQRAVLMFLMMAGAKALGRSYDSLNALSFAALFLLWENPGLLFYAGFLFSFMAVIGVVWTQQAEGGGKENGKKKRKKKEADCESPENEKGPGCVFMLRSVLSCVWKKLGLGTAIQLTTLPLSAWFYYEVPTYAVLINLIVLPVMGLVLFTGIAGGVIGLVSFKAAGVLLIPCRVILSFYRFVCGICERLPLSEWITGRPALWKMALYYMFLVLLTCKSSRLRRNSAEEKDGGPRKKYLLPAGVIGLMLLFCRAPAAFEVDILDVGQGDASYLQTGEGIRIFVDGGSSDVKKAGEYRILPFLKYKGAGRIDYWAVSHTDWDHISGLSEVLESGYPVKTLVFSREVVKDDAYEALLALAKEKGTDVLYLEEGDVLHLGKARLTALFPQKGSVKEDKNAASLVFVYEEGAFSGIFTGDIGIAEEKRLAELPSCREVDFYKAAHHGSRGSNSEELLNRLHPLVSTVSCGRNNRYGHPGKEAVAHMEEAGSAVFYTMEAGQIRLTMEGEELIVQKYLDPLDVFCVSVLK